MKLLPATTSLDGDVIRIGLPPCCVKQCLTLAPIFYRDKDALRRLGVLALSKISAGLLALEHSTGGAIL